MTAYSNQPDTVSDAETTSRIIVALFPRRSEAEAAIRELKTAGFSNDQIGVATHDQIQTAHSAPDPASLDPETAAAAGAVSGGVVGGLLGLIGSLLIPGVGPVVLGGVLASALMGAGIGAATGGLVSALTSLGVTEHEARYFDEGLRAGGTLVTVRAGARTGEALEILRRREADLGPVRVRSSERRFRNDPGYSGPERRLTRV
jgi:uncharacterized membrane protein